MRKGLFLLGATVAVLTSCSNQEVMDVADYANQPIEFSTFVGKNTRAGDITQTSFKKFWVFAQNKKVSESDWHNAFTNVQVNKISEGNWSPVNTYFWEANKEFRFAGYANGESQLDENIVSYDASETTTGTYTGVLTFKDYTTDGTNDLVAGMGNANDYTWKGDAGEAPAVEMTFHHMLSKLTFTFKTKMADTYDVDVINLRIEDATVKSTGKYNKNDGGTVAWTTSGGEESKGKYEFTGGVADITQETFGTLIKDYYAKASTALYVIPQGCGTLKVKFTAVVLNEADEEIGRQDFEGTLGYTPTETETALKKDEWVPGYFYNYTAELNLEDISSDDNAKPITFKPTVEDWKETTDGDDLTLTETSTQS